MSDSNYIPPADVAAQIDAMVAVAGARIERSQRLASVDTTRGNVKIDSQGNALITGEVHEAARMPDSGIDLDRSRAVNAERVSNLQAQLDAVQFDPRTGERSPVLQGQARDLVQMQLTTAMNAAAFDEQRFALLEQQRANDVRWNEGEVAERMTYLRVTGGDPAKMARLQELLGDEELRTAAAAILAARLERARS